LGYPLADVVGKSVVEMHPLDRREEAARIAADMVAGRASECPVPLLARDGTRIEVETRIARGEWDGRPAMFGISRDISKRIRAEQQSRKHLGELARVARLTTMGEMASGMAHELNQPLTAIATYAGTCCNVLEKHHSPAKEQLTDMLDRIERLAVRAGRIVHRLRSFVSRTPPDRAATDLNNLVHEVLVLAEADLRASQVTLRLNLDGSIPQVHVDTIQIQQVLLNLVKNACDAMSVEGCGRRELMIDTALAAADAVEVAVRDRGTGIAREHAEQLFDAFFTTKPNGMGMGLAISRSILEAHGGRLWFVPNADRGCTFRFTIPVMEVETIGHVR
jgi:C4-dicarboxylate-specific signal transduction histidine kinase